MYMGLLKDMSAVIAFPCRFQEYVGSLFVYVPQDVKVVYSWIFSFKVHPWETVLVTRDSLPSRPNQRALFQL